MTPCDTAREAFSDLYDGLLPQPERDALREHLQACPACQAEWVAFQHAVQAVRDLGSAEPSPGFAARVHQQLEAPSWWGRAGRWLFQPARTKVPLHAAALLVLGLAGLLVYEQSPELRRSVPQRTLPPAGARGARPEAPGVPPTSAAPQTDKTEAAGTAPPSAERPPASLAPQDAAPSAPAPPEARVQGAPAREKAAESEPAVPATDALQRAENAAEARRDQMDSAATAGKVEQAPVPGTAAGAGVSQYQQSPPAPAPAAPPAASLQASREASRKALAVRTPDALYSAALTDLAGQRYPQALNGFRAFIAEYPQDPKVPYARLALGDTQAAQGHPLEATQEYEALIQQFPQSPLVPTALYRQAQARMTLGDASGCTLLRALVDRFPRAPEAVQARDALTKRCH